MSENVTQLEVKRAEPREDVIEVLEEALERAREGRIRTIVWMLFEQDGTSETGNAGEDQNRDYVLGCFQRAGLDYYMRRRRDSGHL